MVSQEAGGGGRGVMMSQGRKGELSFFPRPRVGGVNQLHTGGGGGKGRQWFFPDLPATSSVLDQQVDHPIAWKYELPPPLLLLEPLAPFVLVASQFEQTSV